MPPEFVKDSSNTWNITYVDLPINTNTYIFVMGSETSYQLFFGKLQYRFTVANPGKVEIYIHNSQMPTGYSGLGLSVLAVCK